MSKFDDLIAMAGQYATALVEAGRGHILHDEVQEYSEEFCTAVRLLEEEHKALLNDQEELVRVRAELAAIRALEPAAHQYQGRAGEWLGFDDDRHLRIAVEAGNWTLRALYALPEQKK